MERTDLVKEVFKGQLDWLERQAAQEIYAPDFVYAHLIEQLNEFISYSFEEHPLYTEFIKKIDLSFFKKKFFYLKGKCFSLDFWLFYNYFCKK